MMVIPIFKAEVHHLTKKGWQVETSYKGHFVILSEAKDLVFAGKL